MVSEYQRQAVLAALELASQSEDKNGYHIYFVTYSDMGTNIATPDYTQNQVLALKRNYWNEKTKKIEQDLPLLVLADGEIKSISPNHTHKENLEKKIAEMFPKVEC